MAWFAVFQVHDLAKTILREKVPIEEWTDAQRKTAFPTTHEFQEGIVLEFVGANGNRLWLEAALWASDCFNRSAAKSNTGWRSPHEVFSRRLPDLQLIPFFHPGMMHVDRSTKSDGKVVKCFFLNNGHNHSSSTVKVLKSSTEGVRNSSDIVWMVPRTPVLPLPPPAGTGGSVGSVGAAAPTTTPGFTKTYTPPSLSPLSQPSLPPTSQPSLPTRSQPVMSRPSLPQPSQPSQPATVQPLPSKPSLPPKKEGHAEHAHQKTTTGSVIIH